MCKNNISNEEIVESVWHWLIEDDLGWDFSRRILRQNYSIEISEEELKKKFRQYFLDLVGISPYTKCPICGQELLPRKSYYGYFIGCSGFPKCNFIATKTKFKRQKNIL